MIRTHGSPATRHHRQTSLRSLVLLHGLLGHVSNWDDTVAHFRARYHLVPVMFNLYDDDAPYHTVESLTRMALDEMDRTGVDRAVLFGNSMGGQIALKVALVAPERVAGLILTGSAGLLERSVADHAPLNPSREYIREKIREVFYDEKFVTDALVDDIQSTLVGVKNKLRLVKLARSLRACNLHEHLPEVTCPTLLVWGRQDTITPVEVAQVFANRLPHSRMHILDRCGHSPNIEQPEAFNRLAEAFLAEIGFA